MERPQVEYEGEKFRWTGKEWVSSETYLEPPTAVCHRLDELAREKFTLCDNSLPSPDELLEEAKLALENHRGFHHERAENLAHRALEFQHDAGAAAVLCSALRARGKPAEALSWADQFVGSGYPPLLTCRAAALCDLGRPQEARKQIDQVIAIAKKSGKPVSGEAWSAWRRIDSGCP